VAYVDLTGRRRRPWLQVLGLIAAELADNPKHGVENEKSFARWLDHVDVVLGETAMPAREERQGPYHRVLPPTADDKAIDNVLEAFRKALVAAAAGQSLVVAFDHLTDEALTELDWKLLLLELIDPIARGRLEAVRMILVLRDDERPLRLTGPLATESSIRELGPLPGARFVELARSHLLHLGYEREGLDEFLKRLQGEKNDKKDFSPAVLAGLPGVADWSGVKKVAS
jgi:hypothetical protein